MVFVFMLATFIGLGVIVRVSRLLHTPLMSLTNAISAIAVVGSIMVTGARLSTPIRFLGAMALFASMTNIVSGFLITDRMLKMFKSTPGRRIPCPEAYAAFLSGGHRLFIFSLHWMNDPKTARRGVLAGVAAMLLAILATWFSAGSSCITVDYPGDHRGFAVGFRFRKFR